jgi:hypothetical protein
MSQERPDSEQVAAARAVLDRIEDLFFNPVRSRPNAKVTISFNDIKTLRAAMDVAEAAQRRLQFWQQDGNSQ